MLNKVEADYSIIKWPYMARYILMNDIDILIKFSDLKKLLKYFKRKRCRFRLSIHSDKIHKISRTLYGCYVVRLIPLDCYLKFPIDAYNIPAWFIFSLNPNTELRSINIRLPLEIFEPGNNECVSIRVLDPLSDMIIFAMRSFVYGTITLSEILHLITLIIKYKINVEDFNSYNYILKYLVSSYLRRIYYLISLESDIYRLRFTRLKRIFTYIIALLLMPSSLLTRITS